MNKYWKYLIYLGIFSLLAIAAWEIFQTVSGGREEFNTVVVEMPRDVLITKRLETHLDK